MNAVGQVQQGAAGASSADVDERALLGQGMLDGAVVVGDDGGCRRAQGPLDLGAAVVVAVVVAVEDEGNALRGDG